MKLTGREPILPKSSVDPTGMSARVGKCVQRFNGKFERIRLKALELLNSIPAQPIVNREYYFEIDEIRAAYLFSELNRTIDAELSQRVGSEIWFYADFVKDAYRRGSVESYLNIRTQSSDYAKAYATASEYLTSEPFRRRLAILGARQFELMDGIIGETKNDLSRILSEGFIAGNNPRDIADQINRQIGTEKNRAKRIAQTEITGAMRRARWDESEQAQEDFGFRSMMLHMSAMKPTTRIDHAERHGKFYTVNQVREWYAQGANSINCFCTQLDVLVDAQGKPVSSALAKRLPPMAKKRDELLTELRDER